MSADSSVRISQRRCKWFQCRVFVVIALLISSAVAQDVTNPLNLSFPDRGWALHLDVQDLQQQSFRYDPRIDTLGLEAVSNRRGVVLTVFFGPAAPGLSAVGARDSLMAEMQGKGYKLPDLRVYTDREFACADYFGRSAEYSGEQYHDTWAFAVVDSVWMSVHLSGNKYSRLNDERWQAFFDSLQINHEFVTGIRDYLLYGNRYYLMEEFELAIPYYEKALELQTLDAVLPEHYFIVLIDNLGMSYGISGQTEKAIAMFRYGIGHFPEYPMFYYNLACGHAEMKNLDSTLANLERAYQFLDNMIPGEEFPDPFKDDSFRRFWNDRKFKRFMRSHP